MSRFRSSFIDFIKREDIHTAISNYDFDYVYERLKIEKRRDEIIADAIQDAEERIKELEKILEEK